MPDGDGTIGIMDGDGTTGIMDGAAFMTHGDGIMVGPGIMDGPITEAFTTHIIMTDTMATHTTITVGTTETALPMQLEGVLIMQDAPVQI